MKLNKTHGKNIFAISLAAAIVFMSVLAAGNTALADKKKKDKSTPNPAEKVVDLNGKYHAALGLQTDTDKWIYRMGYYHDKYVGKKEWEHLATGIYGKKSYKKIKSEFKDVTINGNGTYTVSLKNADFKGETSFCQMQVSTDIPNTGQITFSNMIVTIDGNEVGSFAEPYIDTSDKETKGNCCLLAINKWKMDSNVIDSECVPQNDKNKISITFTVRGFNYDNPEQKVEPEPTSVQSMHNINENNSDNNADASTPDTTKISSTSDKSDVPMENGEANPVVIIGIIVVAVISIIWITFGVNKRRG